MIDVTFLQKQKSYFALVLDGKKIKYPLNYMKTHKYIFLLKISKEKKPYNASIEHINNNKLPSQLSIIGEIISKKGGYNKLFVIPFILPKASHHLQTKKTLSRMWKIGQSGIQKIVHIMIFFQWTCICCNDCFFSYVSLIITVNFIWKNGLN